MVNLNCFRFQFKENVFRFHWKFCYCTRKYLTRQQWRVVTRIVRETQLASWKLVLAAKQPVGGSGGMPPNKIFNLESPKSAFPAISGMNFPKKFNS